MAPVAAVLVARQVSFNIGEMRAGNMALAIEAFAFAQVHQVVAAVENRPLRIGKVKREVMGVDQHASLALKGEALRRSIGSS